MEARNRKKEGVFFCCDFELMRKKIGEM